MSAAVVALTFLPFGSVPANGVESETSIAAPAAGPDAAVFVSRTNNLANETVAVRWTGFRPSSNPRLNNSGGYDISTTNPVRVYQCRGHAPVSSSECYGAPGFAGIAASGTNPGYPSVPAFTYVGQADAYAPEPDGPANFQDTTTAANGTGSAKIQVFTRREAPSLGCDVDTPCSLVVVPNYGRPHGATEDLLDAPWAWDRRTVIPLHLAATLDSCPFTDQLLRLEGSPAAARLLASWRVGTCGSAKPVAVDYTAIGEPQARNDTAAGIPDIGLTTQPVTEPGRALAYAPLALTGVVVAFQVDDRNGHPVTNMKLNARLLAKLITASYRVADDPNVVGNPTNLFSDKEFLALNPGTAWPLGAPGNHPVLLADLSDLTWTLTRWINSDPDARAFLNGKADPYGTHVNLAYKNIAFPVSNFPVLDEHQTRNFEPLSGLDLTARQLSIAQFPGAFVEYEQGIPIITKPPRQSPGRREIIGIIDAAQATEFQLSTASLQNPAGAFVAPSDATMLAALKHMTKGADGVTRAFDLGAKDRSAYPLTITINGAVPVKAPAAQAAAIVNFLDYAIGAGQVAGTQPGQLSEGYAPLPTELVADVKAARAAVLNGLPAAPTTTTLPAAVVTSTSTTTVPTSSSTEAPFAVDTIGRSADVVAAVTSETASAGRAVTTKPIANERAESAIERVRRVLGLDGPLGFASFIVPLVIIAGLAALVAGSLLMRGKRPRLSWRFRR